MLMNLSQESQTEEELKNKNYNNFFIFWIGQLFSIMGSEIVQFAIVVWLALETQSPIIMSLSMLLAFLPGIIIGPFAGVLVDHWNKKLVLIISDSLQAMATLCLIILFFMDFANIWFVIGLNLFRAIFQAFHSPSFITVVTLMVPKEKLTRINGLIQFSTAIIKMIGPILGAIILSVWSIQNVLWIDIISFLFALIFLLFIKIPVIKSLGGEKKPKLNFILKFKEGFSIINKVSGLWSLLLLAMLTNFLLMPINTLFSLYILIDHAGSNFDLAIVSAAMQFAFVAGALFVSIKKTWKNKVMVFLIGILLVFIGIIIIALAPYQKFWIMIIGGIIGFFGVPILNALMISIVQIIIPPEAMGRVSSILGFLSSIASPLGIILSGPLAELIGISKLFLFSGIIGILTTLITYSFSSLRNLKNFTIKENSIKNEIERNNEQ